MTPTLRARGVRALAASVLAAAAAMAGCSTDTGPAAGGPRLTGRLAAGDNFTCALDHSGIAFCWGAGALGSLGNGGSAESATPVRVHGGPYSSITAGQAGACAIRFDGGVDCWGGAPPHCCGQAQNTLLEPTPVVTSIRFARLALGAQAACGIARAGDAYCFGAQVEGSLGNGEQEDSAVPPVAVSGGHTFTNVSAGVLGGCGVDRDGAAWCWGANLFGELGIGDEPSGDPALEPVLVSGGLRFISVSAGAAYVCGITTTGLTVCWGNNTAGQLGDSTTTDRLVPTPVPGANFVAVFAGAKNEVLDHTCALDAAGAASCWGANDRGQLGTTTAGACPFAGQFACAPAPVAVEGGLSFTTLALGDAHTCGMVADGHVYCWGGNDDGELGDGTTTASATPVLSMFTP